MTTTVCNTETLHIVICMSGVIEIQVSMLFKVFFLRKGIVIEKLTLNLMSGRNSSSLSSI